IGRGTRLNEAHGKQFFTILDFKRATELFADEDFDGPAEQIYVPKGEETVVPPEPADGQEDQAATDAGLDALDQAIQAAEANMAGITQTSNPKDPAGVYDGGATSSGQPPTTPPDKPRRYEISNRVT